MLLTYFVVDANQQIRRVPRDLIEAVWRGGRPPVDLGYCLGEELRIISVPCDKETLLPLMCFFVWTELSDGEITDESRFAAYDAMTRHQGHRYDRTAADRQLAGWPEDWQRQLAVALDVPPLQLRKVGIGGPLLMSDLWGISIDKVLQYFEEACED